MDRVDAMDTDLFASNGSGKFISIANESCLETMKKMVETGSKVDLILTSPPYNTNKKAGKTRTIENATLHKNIYPYVRYDCYVDTLTNEQYLEKTKNLFNAFDSILKENGVVLYNISYGSENTEILPLTMAKVIEDTPFTMADLIVWKKQSAMPNTCSPNKITRIVEFICVFVRKAEIKTFTAYKEKRSIRSTGQQMYDSVMNFIEAKNNDKSCPLNKATFSSELVGKLLKIYDSHDSVVYDPFMGTGTTAIGCLRFGCSCHGSEISEKQCAYATDRIREENKSLGYPFAAFDEDWI